MNKRNFDKLVHSVSLLLGMSLCSLTPALEAAALYKWVDENGQIHYSERMPPAQSRKKHQQLNSQGLVVSTKEAAKSETELALEAEAKRKEELRLAEEARIKELQFRKDQVLLLTFSSEEELSRVREDRLSVLDSVMNLIAKSIDTTTEKLEKLQAVADENYISQDKQVPGGLAQKIEHFSRKIENRNAQLQVKLAEKNKINGQFDVDLARYRHLKVKAGD